MPSTFFGLNIATSGMSTYYAGINTAAHNIANKDTKGYSKQVVYQQAKEALSFKTSYGMVGAGVITTDIKSSRDVYYDYKYRKSNAVYGYYDAKQHYMQNVEDYLYAKDAESGGVTNALNNLFKLVSEQTTDASDTTMRRNIVGAADTLMTFVNETANNLLQAQKEINVQIKSTMEQINNYARQIASLNQQINTLEVYGGTANDLRDQRAKALDDLSKLVDIEVESSTPKHDDGVEEFLVFIGDGVLVDTYNYTQLELITSDTKANQTDADGLYFLKWSNGQSFNCRSTILGGELQGLFEVRDGNNAENFTATLTGYDAAAKSITLKGAMSNPDCSANSFDLSKLNIPESNAKLKLNNYEFEYESFDVSVKADGSYEYTFYLKNDMTAGAQAHLDAAMANGRTATSVGDGVDFRGIPYYMSQLTEFVRTFSANFNQVQNTGYDLYDQAGRDLFVTKKSADGQEYDMTELIYNNTDRCYYLDGVAQLGLNGQDEVLNIHSQYGAGDKATYYNMTALNAVVSREMLDDCRKLALSEKANNGVASYGNLTRMSVLREDNTMFKQGIPSDFLAVMVATIGVDGNKITSCATNSENIVNAVENRRLSKAGVDEDEEAQDMLEFQNMLKVQYRVISIMNDVLDRLINSTGV